jgi:hypothetical protein
MDLRHQWAHGTTSTWEANPPKRVEGRLGREIRVRTRTGNYEIRWLDFEKSDETIQRGWESATKLSALIASLVRGLPT